MKDNSVLIKTPTSQTDENKLSTSIQAKLGPDGSVEITGILKASGNIESDYRERLNSLTTDKKKEWLSRRIGRYSPNYKLLSYDLEKIHDSNVPLEIGFTAKLFQYSTQSGNEFLINLNFLSRVDAEDIPQEKGRKYPVDNWFTYTLEDEVTFNFPDGLMIKAIPEEQDTTLPFGSFQTHYSSSKNQLIYKRTKTITKRLVEPELFEEYKTFLSRIYTLDRSFVVLRKTE